MEVSGVRISWERVRISCSFSSASARSFSFYLLLRGGEIIDCLRQPGQLVVALHGHLMLHISGPQRVDAPDDVADIGQPLAQQEQKQDHEKSHRNQQAQVCQPAVHLEQLLLREDDAAGVNDIVYDGRGPYPEQSEEDQRNDKRDRQHAEYLMGQPPALAGRFVSQYSTPFPRRS